jgi:high affinity Mn2+ porin
MKKFILILFFLILSYLLFSQTRSDSSSEKWSTHLQLSIVNQWHEEYHFPYAGPSSLDSNREHALSLTTTLFLGRKLWKNAPFFLNPEITGGNGLSMTHEAAGFPMVKYTE